jgi:hypothetical protein
MATLRTASTRLAWYVIFNTLGHRWRFGLCFDTYIATPVAIVALDMLEGNAPLFHGTAGDYVIAATFAADNHSPLHHFAHLHNMVLIPATTW